MKVPMKVDYGVRALVELAQGYGGGAVSTGEIADRQHIPEAYLNQLLMTLGKAGLISSRRGPQGGYALAKSPKEISLGMVISSLEGESALLECISVPECCAFSTTCAQREVWSSVEEVVQRVLRATTIADLVTRQEQLKAVSLH